MSRAYVPGLEVSFSKTLNKLRELPISGEVLVELNQKVNSKDTVLKAEMPGEVFIAKLSDRMGVDIEQAIEGTKVKKGDIVKIGDVISETKSFFGLFTSRYISPIDGEVEFITKHNSHVGIRQNSTPFEVNAYINGEINKIEEKKAVSITTSAAFIQGIFGVGGEKIGEILNIKIKNDERLTIDHLKNLDLSNKVIIAGKDTDIETLRYASSHGAVGMLLGSIDAQTLAEYIGFEIGVSITGDEELSMTLIITEGFGELAISDRIRSLCNQFEGEEASINGATQVRAGAMRPEIIISHNKKQDTELEQKEKEQDNSLEIGKMVRIIRVPFFGLSAKVIEMPNQPQEIPSGAKVRVVKVRFEDGREEFIPRANLELL